MVKDPRDLTDVQSVMNWMNVNNQSYKQEEQGVIQLCITAASLEWIRWCGRTTLNSIVPFNERYDGSGSDRQFLRNGPILKVFSLIIAGVNIPASADGLTVPGYWIDDDRESISIIGTDRMAGVRASGSYGVTGTNYRVWGGWKFAMGRGTVAVRYLAGYSLLPYEIKTIPGTTFQVTVNNATNFVIDMGVTYVASGLTLTNVASAPSQGQYTVTSGGVYTFNAADASSQVSISYGYNGTPADLQEAINKFVAQNYKRRQTVDEKSKIIPGSGNVIYRDWVMAPEVDRVLQDYKRQALFVS